MGIKLGVLILSVAAMSVSFSGQADAARYQVLILSDDLFNQVLVLEVEEGLPEPESMPPEFYPLGCEDIYYPYYPELP